MSLFFSFFGFLISSNVEVFQFIGGLVSSNNTEPVSELVLLQELFGQVLNVSLRESNIGRHSESNGSVIIAFNDHIAGKIGSTSIDLDSVVHELFLLTYESCAKCLQIQQDQRFDHWQVQKRPKRTWCQFSCSSKFSSTHG
jgi:hypothetical protein